MALSKTEAQLSRDATNAGARLGVGGSDVDLGGLFAAHAAAMYRAILVYTGGRGELAEKAVGEAFSRAAARAARLRDPVAWLYRVAFSVANDELRRERRTVVASGTARPGGRPPRRYAVQTPHFRLEQDEPRSP